MFELNDFSSIKIGVASPEKIRELSKGEVTKPETINYRTQKPERDGLFCERIFGPMKDWECHCGKYKRIRYKGVICEKCGVEVTRAKVRRERMGHIELAAPVSHIWYFRGVPSRIGLVLDMSPKALEQVIYFASYVVIDPGKVPELEYKQIINDKELMEIEAKYGDSSVTGLKVGMGAEAIRELLMAVDLEKECAECRKIIDNNQAGQKRVKAVKRIEILESFRKSGNRPEWMILTVLPVLPPELRPMVQLDGGRFASSDLNDLYRRVINRNNRLKRMMELGAPDMIVKNEKRMLQEAVDALIDNGRRGKALSGPSNRELKSLSGMLRGKQGRFRQNLLGKRVDYSGRSVIVVGPDLKLYQCGLPKEMAIELFKPFVMKKLVESGQCHNIKSAKRTVEKAKPLVWDVLEDVIKDHPVLLNRAPTLHRLSIQAFEPVLIEGRAIKIHPLVCTAFNADFDGDQMAVHVPLSIEAQAEARYLMLSSNNILKLSDGKPVMQPSQDMVMGAYYLTIIRREEGKYYRWSGDRYVECSPEEEGAEEYIPGSYISEDEALMAYQTKFIHMQDEIYVRRTVVIDDKNSPFCGESVTGRTKTTVGRIIFNNEMPQDLGFVKREKKEDYIKYEISYEFLGSNVAVGKKQLGKIVERCFKTGGAPRAADILDKIKTLGYKYSTVGAITTSVFDMHIPAEKQKIIEETEQKVYQIERKYQRGLLREEERYNAVINAWDTATDEVTDALKKSLDKFNPIWMMANSGARGSIDQMKQLSGMRGLMVNPQGKKIEVPVKSCFRQGLSVLEYFISSHGGRKGLADTALKTADSGYLTRRLVDVSQDVIVREDDCMAGSKKPRGMIVKPIIGPNGEIIEGLYDRVQGRFLAEDVADPETGEILYRQNEFVTDEIAEDIVNKHHVQQVSIRSIFSCNSRYGVCAKCYGKNMATNTPVQVGEAVGVIAAQSIGEPGTQLTMRTFHTGGIAATGDITQGLPRVEELFEARKPKGCSTLCEVSGVAHIDDSDNLKHIIIRDSVTNEQKKEYVLPFNAELKVKEGDKVEPGTQLNAGSVYPQDILRISGVKGVQDYILEQVQSVYRSQGVDINDKHVEIIVRQMLRKVRIESAGSTDLLPGETVDMFAVEEANQKAIENGGTPALQKRVLLGITKAALSTDSFLSAASFQETARVLTDAAIKNKVDPLMGLKENVIIGKLIPAGTGVKEYKNMSPVINPGYNSVVAPAAEEIKE
ncbi:MAG: DNA-directed RNA polymerase subunit beta' [Clostridia bacterium]|nr:DNA-directed RNA polymerase subunit beta' [Clostridia bacterium]